MEDNTRTWTRVDGEKETVEIGSDRDKELMKQLNNAGIYIEGDPNAPEECVTWEELQKIQKRGPDGKWYIDKPTEQI